MGFISVSLTFEQYYIKITCM